MNLLERVLTLLRANLDTVVAKADDPDKTLKQLQLDMRNQLVQVKTEVAKAIADGHLLQKRSLAKKTEAENWLKKAEYAVQQGDDSSARESLHHYNDCNKLAQRYQQQKRDQEQLVATMRSALLRLEAKIVEVESTIELLESQKRNALIQQRVLDVLHKTGRSGESQNIEAEARATANFQNAPLEQQLQQIKKGRTPSSSPSSPESESARQPRTAPLSTTPLEGTRRRRERSPLRSSQNMDEVSTDKDLNLDYLKKILEGSHNQE